MALHSIHAAAAWCGVLLTILAGAGSIAQDPAAQPAITIIRCGTLFAKPGAPPLRNATIVVEDGIITDVLADQAQAGPPGATVIDLSHSFVLPGLIDCHTHITSQHSADVRLRMVQESEADAAVQGAAYAKRTLEAGFTTIRNVGSLGDAGFAVRDGINQGLIPGPRILEAGRSISPTGGHGDGTNGYRDDLFDAPGAAEGVGDGADGCRKAVRAQVKRGADVIKLTATGGVLSNVAAGTGQQFFDDELKAIVETAHLLKRKVAAHAHGADGIKAALRAGVDSIEHGTFVDDEAISLFKETGAYLVPTILAGVTVAERAEQPGYYPRVIADKARAVGPVIQAAFGRAYKGGVKIAFGTDSGVSDHGQNAREFTLMVEAGMPASEAIKAATINAADLCGLSDQVGTIEKGKRADIIAVQGDPLQKISELERVIFVMRDGVVHKD